METKQFGLQLKELNEEGRFIGLSAIYNTVDRAGDIIVPGAFAKTIAERGKNRPLYHDHKINVGVSNVEDSPEGLLTEGFLNLEKASARDVYSDLKFYKSHGLDFGMSFAYRSFPDKVEKKNGIRYLKEIELFETTLTAIPLHPDARTLQVKGIDVDVEELAQDLIDIKSGKKISKNRMDRLIYIRDEIQSLMDEAGAETQVTTLEVEPTSEKAIEPDIHSLLKNFTFQEIANARTN